MYYDRETIIKTMSSPKLKSTLNVPKNYVAMRGITSKTMEFYDVRTVVNSSTSKPEKIIFPYGDEAQKVRDLTEKQFMVTGTSMAPLFGMDKFTPGQHQSITITEGEFDALSVFQMLGSKYPVVSVRSSSTARSDCSNAREFLNSFDRIYLCFDNDNPGEKATKEVSQLFDLNKVYFVKLGRHKDANELLQADKAREFLGTWWNSRKFVPKGIISSLEEQKQILAKQKEAARAEYPFPSLQEMTYGIRSKELVLITAQEKIGKTEFIRAIEYKLLKDTEENVGIIHLEEEEQRSIQGLVGLHVGEPIHLPDCMVSVSDQQKALEELTKTDDRLHVYTHFGSDDPDVIIDVIRSMVTVLGCKYLFIDHITMLVTGFEGDDERRKLDYLSTKFAELTRELDFTMFLISHVNDDGKTRGSRNIAKVADLIVSLNRDIEAQDENSRNTTYVTVRGNRFSGRTGPAGTLKFDSKRFRLDELRYDDNPELSETIEDAVLYVTA